MQIRDTLDFKHLNNILFGWILITMAPSKTKVNGFIALRTGGFLNLQKLFEDTIFYVLYLNMPCSFQYVGNMHLHYFLQENSDVYKYLKMILFWHLFI